MADAKRTYTQKQYEKIKADARQEYSEIVCAWQLIGETQPPVPPVRKQNTTGSSKIFFEATRHKTDIN